MAETSDIKRRVAGLEQRTGRIAWLLDLIARRVARTKRNAKSSALTPGEIAAFRQRMEAHGMDDEESDWRHRSGSTDAKR